MKPSFELRNPNFILESRIYWVNVTAFKKAANDTDIITISIKTFTNDVYYMQSRLSLAVSSALQIFDVDLLNTIKFNIR